MVIYYRGKQFWGSRSQVKQKLSWEGEGADIVDPLPSNLAGCCFENVKSCFRGCFQMSTWGLFVKLSCLGEEWKRMASQILLCLCLKLSTLLYYSIQVFCSSSGELLGEPNSE